MEDLVRSPFGDYVSIATRQPAAVILGLQTRNTSLTHQDPPLVLLSDATIADKDLVCSLRCWHQRYDNTTETQNQNNSLSLPCYLF